MNGQTLVEEALRLDSQARTLKGEIARKRRALQDVRARQAELERQCERFGITVIYPGEGDHPWPQNQSSTSRP